MFFFKCSERLDFGKEGSRGPIGVKRVKRGQEGSSGVKRCQGGVKKDQVRSSGGKVK